MAKNTMDSIASLMVPTVERSPQLEQSYYIELVEKSMTTKTAILGEQRVLLKNISWQLFESLLDAMGEDRASRLAYDRGVLEIMSQLMPHEHIKRLIEQCVEILVDELNINIKSVGSMTCKREYLERGIEPDSGFYIQNEPLVKSR